MKKNMIIVLVLALALAGFYALVQYRAVQKANLESAERAAEVLNVRITKPTEQIVQERVSFVGSIEADETVPVYPKLSNLTITRINVNAGDEVKEGQVLATLDSSLMATSLQQAR